MTKDELIDRLREEFLKRRRQKQPSYHGGSQLENALNRAADNCIALSMGPEAYMTALYRRYGGTHDQFFPNMIGGKRAYEIADEFKKEHDTADVEDSWAIQVRHLSHAISHTSRTLEDLLLDRISPFTPWFRVVLTVEENPEILRRYAKEARALLTPKLKEFLLKKGVTLARLERIINYE